MVTQWSYQHHSRITSRSRWTQNCALISNPSSDNPVTSTYSHQKKQLSTWVSKAENFYRDLPHPSCHYICNDQKEAHRHTLGKRWEWKDEGKRLFLLKCPAYSTEICWLLYRSCKCQRSLGNCHIFITSHGQYISLWVLDHKQLLQLSETETGHYNVKDITDAKTHDEIKSDYPYTITDSIMVWF